MSRCNAGGCCEPESYRYERVHQAFGFFVGLEGRRIYASQAATALEELRALHGAHRGEESQSG